MPPPAMKTFVGRSVMSFLQELVSTARLRTNRRTPATRVSARGSLDLAGLTQGLLGVELRVLGRAAKRQLTPPRSEPGSAELALVGSPF